MAYYYVKSGGTATGDTGRYASPKTSTDNWATAFTATSEYYATLEAASGATTPPAAGDFLLISDTSAHVTATNTSLSNAAGSTTGVGVHIVCVDNDNVGVSAVASTALETSTGSGDINLCTGGANKTVNYYGYYSSSGDDTRLVSTVDQTVTFTKCTIKTEDQLSMVQDGCTVTMNDTSILMNNSGCTFLLSNGITWNMVGGDMTMLGTIPPSLFQGFSSGGLTLNFVGVDLSTFSNNLLGSAGDCILLKFNRVQFHASVTIPGITLKHGQRLELTNCSFGTAAGEDYQFLIYDELNQAEDATNLYRTASESSSGGTQFSIRVDTGANVSKFHPFVFDLPTRYAALSSTATDLIRTFILSADTLYTDDIWITIIYPDGTNAYVSNSISGLPSDMLLDSTTELDTNTEAWTNRTTENRYQIDKDTVGDAGTDCVPYLRVFIAKPSWTGYVCSTPELS